MFSDNFSAVSYTHLDVYKRQVLDRVISQASSEDECLLYRLANYKNGGELIDAYNVGGQAEVEKLINEQFGVLMYNDGKGQVINRAEYLRWKFRDIKQVTVNILQSTYKILWLVYVLRS